MKFRIELHQVVALIVVRCDDKFGIHGGVSYIRYLILVHKTRSGGESEDHYEGVFIDDPDADTCLGIYKGVSNRALLSEVQAPCPFCQAHSNRQ